MIIQHNISAMTTNNNLNISDKNISKSSEKLSTGYRINRAADDASGLTISEKLRGQVRGLNRAEKNIEEGVSLIETADGGMEEIEAILHRQRELSVQAANDTNTLSDREAIQTEIDMLNDEIDRITDETEYNTIKILQGGIKVRYGTKIRGSLSDTVIRTNNVGLAGASNESYMAQAYRIVYEYKHDSTTDEIIESVNFFTKYPTNNDYNTNPSNTNSIENKRYPKPDPNNPKPTDLQYNSLINNINNSASNTYNEEKEYYAAILDFSNVKISDLIGKDKIQGFHVTCGQCPARYSIQFVDKKGSQVIDEGRGEGANGNDYTIRIGLKDVNNGKDIVNTIIKELRTNPEIKNRVDSNHFGIGIHGIRFKQDESNEAQLIIYDYRDSTPKPSGEKGRFNSGVFDRIPIYEGQAPLYIQEGANSGQLVKIDLPNTSTKMLGTRENVDVLSSDNATKTIQTFDNAIDYISRKRTELAAKQNSLEYRADYNTNASINQQAAESLIRDTNMADEMVNYSKSSILQQASQSMLAQANQVPQNVISLLQGT